MDPLAALPYVDSLVKEYLLFRGFTQTLQAFNTELSEDKGFGFQADQVKLNYFPVVVVHSLESMY